LQNKQELEFSIDGIGPSLTNGPTKYPEKCPTFMWLELMRRISFLQPRECEQAIINQNVSTSMRQKAAVLAKEMAKAFARDFVVGTATITKKVVCDREMGRF
jgi:hypothetical protein